MRQIISFSLSRQVHVVFCATCLVLVSWALLSKDPMALVRGSRLSFVQTISDVILHFGVYSVFSLACLTLSGATAEGQYRRNVIGLLMLHAIGTELVQSYIPTRTCDARDALANMAGIAAGAMLAAWAVRQIAESRQTARTG